MDDNIDDNEYIEPHAFITLPKKPKDNNNIINIASRHRNISREQICLLFIEVATRTDHCFNFAIKFWLTQYEKFDDNINFPEAALLIVNASKIFGKKIDGLYQFLLHLDSDTHHAIQLVEETVKNAKKVREPRKKKELQVIALSDTEDNDNQVILKDRSKRIIHDSNVYFYNNNNDNSDEVPKIHDALNTNQFNENDDDDYNYDDDEDVDNDYDSDEDDMNIDKNYNKDEQTEYISIFGNLIVVNSSEKNDSNKKENEEKNVHYINESPYNVYIKELIRRSALIKFKIIKIPRRGRFKKPERICDFSNKVLTDFHDNLDYGIQDIFTKNTDNNDSDYDDDDDDMNIDDLLVNCRRDFFTYMSYIDNHNQSLFYNYKNSRAFEKEDLIATNKLFEEDHRLRKITEPFQPILFKKQKINGTYLPPDYVEEVYNVKLLDTSHYNNAIQKEITCWNKLGPEKHEERIGKCILIGYRDATIIIQRRNIIKQIYKEKWISEEQYTNAIEVLYRKCNLHIGEGSINDIVSLTDFGHGQINNKTIENNPQDICDIYNTLLPLSPLSDTEVIENNINKRTFDQKELAYKLLTSQLRIRVDNDKTTKNLNENLELLPRLSDLDPSTRSFLLPRVQLFNIFPKYDKKTLLNLTINVANDPTYIDIVNDPTYIDDIFSSPNVPYNMITKNCSHISEEAENLISTKCKIILPTQTINLNKRKMPITTENVRQLKCIKLTDIIKPERKLNVKRMSLLAEERGDDFHGFNVKEIESQGNLAFVKAARNFLLALRAAENEEDKEDDFHGFNDEDFESQETRALIISRTISNDSGFCTSPNFLFLSQIDSNISPRPSIERSPSYNSKDNELQQAHENRNSEIDNQIEAIACIEKGVAAQREANNVIEERIKKWQKFVKPILISSKKRSFFDIHAYGRHIIITFPSQKNKVLNSNNSVNNDKNNDCINDSGFNENDIDKENDNNIVRKAEVIDFNDVMADKEHGSTARYFLSVLQLANSGNVEIINENKSNKKSTTFSEFKLKLLNPILNVTEMSEAQNIENYETKTKKLKIDDTETTDTTEKILKEIDFTEEIELRRNANGKLIAPRALDKRRLFYRTIKMRKLLRKSERNPLLKDLENLHKSSIHELITMADRVKQKMSIKRPVNLIEDVSEYSSDSEMEYELEELPKSKPITTKRIRKPAAINGFELSPPILLSPPKLLPNENRKINREEYMRNLEKSRNEAEDKRANRINQAVLNIFSPESVVPNEPIINETDLAKQRGQEESPTNISNESEELTEEQLSIRKAQQESLKISPPVIRKDPVTGDFYRVIKRQRIKRPPKLKKCCDEDFTNMDLQPLLTKFIINLESKLKTYKYPDEEIQRIVSLLKDNKTHDETVKYIVALLKEHEITEENNQPVEPVINRAKSIPKEKEKINPSIANKSVEKSHNNAPVQNKVKSNTNKKEEVISTPIKNRSTEKKPAIAPVQNKVNSITKKKEEIIPLKKKATEKSQVIEPIQNPVKSSKNKIEEIKATSVRKIICISPQPSTSGIQRKITNSNSQYTNNSHHQSYYNDDSEDSDNEIPMETYHRLSRASQIACFNKSFLNDSGFISLNSSQASSSSNASFDGIKRKFDDSQELGKSNKKKC